MHDESKIRVEDAASEARATRALLLYAFVPFWFVPAVVDWAFHRQTKIESTSGTRESATHLAMMASVGVPLTLALLCEIDAPVLASAIVGTLVHEAITVYDVAYANARRPTPPGEQHIHAFLEVMPFAGTFMLLGTHPAATRALWRTPRSALARLHGKKQPVPTAYRLAFFGAVTAFIALPYTEEFVRCFRVRPTLAEVPVPEHRS